MPVIAHLLKATVPAVILGAGLTLASNATASANTPGQDSQNGGGSPDRWAEPRPADSGARSNHRQPDFR